MENPNNDSPPEDEDPIVSSDVWFCTNCGPVTNVSTAGEATCLECGDIIGEYH